WRCLRSGICGPTTAFARARSRRSTASTSRRIGARRSAWSANRGAARRPWPSAFCRSSPRTRASSPARSASVANSSSEHPLTHELKFLLEQDGFAPAVRDMLAMRAAGMQADKASVAANELMPILQQEASLIEDAQAMIAKGPADPETLKRDLLDLVDRRERAWN